MVISNKKKTRRRERNDIKTLIKKYFLNIREERGGEREGGGREGRGGDETNRGVVGDGGDGGGERGRERHFFFGG